MKHDIKKSAWRGYTLDELQYERAITTVRRDIQRQRVAEEIAGLRSNFVAGATGSIASKLVSSMKFFDFAADAYKIGIKLVKIYRRFKRKAE